MRFWCFRRNAWRQKAGADTEKASAVARALECSPQSVQKNPPESVGRAKGFESSGRGLDVCKTRQFVRVVKELDLKSNGVTRAGSNPAAVVFYAERKVLNLLVVGSTSVKQNSMSEWLRSWTCGLAAANPCVREEVETCVGNARVLEFCSGRFSGRGEEATFRGILEKVLKISVLLAKNPIALP